MRFMSSDVKDSTGPQAPTPALLMSTSMPPNAVRASSIPPATLLSLATSISTTLAPNFSRSEEHTSELQSHLNLVCRLLLEKKKPTYCRLPNHRTVRPHASRTYTT